MPPIQRDKNHPRVSIGLPVYNGGTFIRPALDSLLHQTYSDFELVICDNVSTDETEEICLSYASQDKRIRYYRNEKNIGAVENFNRVFRLSTGHYFKWASADDCCADNLIERCVAKLDALPDAVLACGRTRFIDEQGNFLNLEDPGWNLTSPQAHERLRYVIYAGHWVNCHYGVMRWEALKSTLLLANYAGGDYRFLAELSLAGKFIEVPDYLLYRRIHSEESSRKTNPDQQVEFYRSERAAFLPEWRRTLDMARLIAGSSLAWPHKFDLGQSLLQATLWRRHDLLRELHAVWRQSFGGRTRLGQLPLRFIPSSRHGSAETTEKKANHGLR